MLSALSSRSTNPKAALFDTFHLLLKCRIVGQSAECVLFVNNTGTSQKDGSGKILLTAHLAVEAK